MTRHPDPDEQAARHWLTRHQDALAHALDELLDVEASLREILLQSHHDTAVDSLDTVLDTEAGLTAILPNAPQSPATTPHSHTGVTATEEPLSVLSSADRMTVRNDPAVRAAIRSFDRDRDRVLAIGRVVAHRRDYTRDFSAALALAFERPTDLARASDIARACDIARALERSPDPVRAIDRNLVYDLVVDLTEALARDLLVARGRALTLDLDRDRALDLDLARAHTRVRIVASKLERDRSNPFLHFDVAGAPSLARILRALRALDPTRTRTRDLELDLALERVFDRAFFLRQAFDRELDLERSVIVDIRSAEVGRTIGLALCRKPPVLDETSLHTLLDDFTTADLRNADLSGISLNGVRWSEYTTQWPPTVDVENLKARSAETPPGSGTWVVRSGPTTIRDLADW